MKSLFLLTGLLVFASCVQEDVASYSKLTHDEQVAIDQMNANRCNFANSPFYANFKKYTLENVYDSTAYNRKRHFYHELKAGNDIKRKIDIVVWKRDTNVDEIYFLINETTIGTESKFLRITRTLNEEMIDNLLTDHCLSGTSKYYNTITTGISGPVGIKNTYEKVNPSTTTNKDYYVDTYSLPFTRLPIFANYNLSRTITTKNADGATVGTVVSYTSTFATKDDYDLTSTNPATYASIYCDVQKEGSATKFQLSQNPLYMGYYIECKNVMPADWHLTL